MWHIQPEFEAKEKKKEDEWHGTRLVLVSMKNHTASTNPHEIKT